MKHLIFALFLIYSSAYCELVDHFRILNDKTPIRSIRNIDYIYVINLEHRKEKYQQTLEQFAPYGIIPYRFSAINGWKLPIETIWDVGLVFGKEMRPGGMGTVFRMDKGKEYHSHEIVEEEGTHYFCHCAGRGVVGCLLSHLNVMNDAVHSGYDIIWICEDDIEIVRDPNILSRYIDDLDRLVGRDNWDVFYTFCDYRGPEGEYYTPYGANYRPNVDTRDQEKFNINQPISNELRQMGTRFGTQSMIWNKNGMKKTLDFYKKNKIFLPYDLDLALITDIKIYSVIEDVVTNALNSLSDLGNDAANNEGVEE